MDEQRNQVEGIGQSGLIHSHLKLVGGPVGARDEVGRIDMNERIVETSGQLHRLALGRRHRFADGVRVTQGQVANQGV